MKKKFYLGLAIVAVSIALAGCSLLLGAISDLAYQKYYDYPPTPISSSTVAVKANKDAIKSITDGKLILAHTLKYKGSSDTEKKSYNVVEFKDHGFEGIADISHITTTIMYPKDVWFDPDRTGAVKTIGESAFASMPDLITVDFRNLTKLDKIKTNAFKDCPKIKCIILPTVPEGETGYEIKSGAFFGGSAVPEDDSVDIVLLAKKSSDVNCNVDSFSNKVHKIRNVYVFKPEDYSTTKWKFLSGKFKKIDGDTPGALGKNFPN